MFCNIPPENAISNLTAPILYEVPLMLEQEGLADVVVQAAGSGLPRARPDRVGARWWSAPRPPPTRWSIALVGKYVALHDAYLSVVEALTHGGIENDVKVEIRWVDSETGHRRQRRGDARRRGRRPRARRLRRPGH